MEHTNITHLDHYIIYLLIFRSLIITAGVICIILGYKLLQKGINSKKSKIETSISKFRMRLFNVAPGTLFSLFGTFLICMMLYKGTPELTIQEIIPPDTNVIEHRHSTKQINKENAEALTSNDTMKVNLPHKNNSQKKHLVYINAKGANDHIDMQVKKHLENVITINSYTIKATEFRNSGNIKMAKEYYQKAIDELSNPINELAWIMYKERNYKEAIELSRVSVILSPNNANCLDTYAQLLYKLKRYPEALDNIKKASSLNKKYKKYLPKFENAVKNN